jgi:hypothetical protein
MTKNIIHLKDHQFKKGFDPRRNTNGAPKGKNFRYAFRQKMFEKHEKRLENIFDFIMQEAENGKFEYIKLCALIFVPTDNADNTVDNCDDLTSEEITNIPKTELQDMRSKFVDMLSRYNKQEIKE